TGISSTNTDINEITSIPNPFSDESVINFRFDEHNFRTAQIGVYNSVGQMIRSYPIHVAEGNLYWGNDLPSGTYFIVVNVNDEMKKMIPVVKEK
ncbi:MAG: T9SS type A sorting domain-containing protein, partial [Chitinophagales bacterium]